MCQDKSHNPHPQGAQRQVGKRQMMKPTKDAEFLDGDKLGVYIKGRDT